MTTNTTRRSLLRLGAGALAYSAGAAVAAGGIVLAHDAKGAIPAVDRRAWDRAVADYRKAVTVYDAFHSAHVEHVSALPLGPDRNAAIRAIPKLILVECDRLGELVANAESRLMHTPTPDAAAFTYKFAVANADDDANGGWGEMLIAEAKRLSGGEA